MLVCVSGGCTPKAAEHPSVALGRARARVDRSTSAAKSAGDIVWQSATGSPTRGDGRDRLSFCGEPDRALDRAAERLAERQAAGSPLPDALELAFYLRVEGEPHVWPHEWTLFGAPLDPADEAGRLRRFLSSLTARGVTRCGIGRARSARGEAVAVLVAFALADLSPLPTRVHAGQWLRFDARMLVPTRAAKLVVLGPSGLPRTVPTTLHGERVEAAFAVDRVGPFTVQLLADVQGGPRPVLEAALFADVEPPAAWVAWPAPGEQAASATGDDAAALRRMVNDARENERLPALRTSALLDQAALEHARAMRDSGALAHDTGDGDPLERLRKLGAQVAVAGENVAHEDTVVRAHRALWASPSHRSNLLDARFTAMGIGIARDDDGSSWVCETFADFAEPGIARHEPPEDPDRGAIFRQAGWR